MARISPLGRVQLAGSVSWQLAGTQIYVHGDRVLELSVSDPEDAARLFSLLERGADREEAVAACTDKDLALTIIGILTELNLLVRAPSPSWEGTLVERQVHWLSAYGVDADIAQSNLAGARAAILGLGGIGAVVLQHLLAAGVTRFCLIDCDRVEAHNLNRQPIYQSADIGRWKVEAASAYAARQNPRAQVVQIAERIDQSEDLHRVVGSEDWDCLVVAADQPPGRIQGVVTDFCEQSAVPILGAACGFDYGTWGPLLTPGLARAWRATQDGPLHLGAPLQFIPRPTDIMRASFGPTNAILASLLAQDVIFLLAGLPVQCRGKICTVHFPTLRVQVEPIGGIVERGES